MAFNAMITAAEEVDVNFVTSGVTQKIVDDEKNSMLLKQIGSYYMPWVVWERGSDEWLFP